MKIFTPLLTFLAPHECIGCNTEGTLLCTACAEHLPPAEERCYKCHKPRRGYVTCPECRADAPLTVVYAATTYDGAAKDLIWRLKFARASAASEDISRVLAARLRKAYGNRRNIVITHAPTATVRVRQRGYDQAGLVARGIAYQLGKNYRPLLGRFGKHKQVGSSREERAARMDGAFYARSNRALQGAHILLIDDVITTGATLESAARALLEAGAKRVDAIVFAQAQLKS